MKTDALFKDLSGRDNVLVIENIDNSIKNIFEERYSRYRDRFFYEQFTHCGGVIIDNWIRLYGCGELNVVEKNEKYNNSNDVDILIGEDVLGGLFGLRDEYVYYFAPDTNRWENLRAYYTEFIYWLTNRPNDVNQFYELFRWITWKEDCKKLKTTEGYHFYPLLQFNCAIEKRDRRIVPIDELIRFNLNYPVKNG